MAIQQDVNNLIHMTWNMNFISVKGFRVSYPLCGIHDKKYVQKNQNLWNNSETNWKETSSKKYE